MQRTPEIEAYWAAFRKATSLAHDHYVVALMGDSPELMNELVGLMLAGRKRATASLARDFEGAEPLPKVGDHVVVVDGAGAPRCIWRTTEVTIKPLIEADDAFAWDEGEGDRSRAFWLDAHQRCFARQAAREGFAMHDRMPTVFERFVLVWPPEVAA
ncbi:MAG: ASCH domain-containing protein [Geminicoccaceae bacterium]